MITSQQVLRPAFDVRGLPMTKTSFFIALLCLSACASDPILEAFPITYAVEDAPDQARIYLRYKNETQSPVCLYPTSWPDAHGRIDSAKGRAFVNVSGRKYTSVDFDTGYCPGCALRVQPGAEVVGFLNYSDFSLPHSDYHEKKSVSFAASGTRCSDDSRGK